MLEIGSLAYGSGNIVRCTAYQQKLQQLTEQRKVITTASHSSPSRDVSAPRARLVSLADVNPTPGNAPAE
jgi:hypothetical protein